MARFINMIKQREIKFRAWDKTKNIMIYPKDLSIFTINLVGEIFAIDGHAEKLNKDEFILLQYTGLKDKNGKEIWEGDIVEYPQVFDEPKNVGEIKYNDEFASFDIQGWFGGYGLCSNVDSIEIIGNIYENPELLK